MNSDLETPSLPFAPPKLPEGWDPVRDLLMILGRGAGPRAEWLLRQGHARVLVYLPKDAEEEALPVGAQVFRSRGELIQRILGWTVGTAPRHIVLQRTEDTTITADFQRELGRSAHDAVMSHQVQSNTVIQSGPTWLRQGLENLGPLGRFPSIAPLFRKFEGWPAICISPGPSLSKNLHLLREVQDRAVFITGTHALSLLQKEGIHPHLVLMADAGDLLRHLRDVDLQQPEAFLIGGTCRRENFEIDARRIMGFASNGPVDDWAFAALGEDARLSTGGSVACSGVSMAIRMGCNPVVLVGQDLAFGEGRFYAEGSLDGMAKVSQTQDGRFFLEVPDDFEGPSAQLGGVRSFTKPQPQVTVPGYHGGEVPTSRVFQVFLTWFEALSEVVEGEVRMINSTEGGARIKGMEQLPLSTVLADFQTQERTVGEVIDDAFADVPLERRRQRLAREANNVVRALEECSELSRVCIRRAEEAKSDESSLGSLDRAEEALKKGLEPLRLLSVYAQGPILEAKTEAAAAKELSANLEASKKLYSVIREAASELRAPLEQALQELTLETAGEVVSAD